MNGRPSPDPYVHSVGPWQHILGYWLRIRIPYALCGMWLGEEPGVEYSGPDGPMCPSCASQITIRHWFRLPKAERRARAEAFRAADEALQANGDAEQGAGIDWETETYHELNGRVNDLWPTVPWWVRAPALPHVAADIARLLGRQS
jgi:hypothetical protein